MALPRPPISPLPAGSALAAARSDAADPVLDVATNATEPPEVPAPYLPSSAQRVVERRTETLERRDTPAVVLPPVSPPDNAVAVAAAAAGVALARRSVQTDPPVAPVTIRIGRVELTVAGGPSAAPIVAPAPQPALPAPAHPDLLAAHRAYERRGA